jgi:hypothetical protein
MGALRSLFYVRQPSGWFAEPAFGPVRAGLRVGFAREPESSQPAVPSRTAGEGEDHKGAGGFPQVGDKLWRTSCPGRGNSWMEGTSGAADRGPLRGGSGEAALGPGWCPRKRAPIRAGGKAARAAFPGPAAPRERVVLGAVAGIAKAGSRGGFVAGPVTRASSTRAGSRRRWLLRPVSPRAHDTRCPSRSGWGEALPARNRGERRRVAKAVRPLARETSAGAVLKQERAARLVSSGGSAPPGRVFQMGAQAHVGDQWGAQAHPWLDEVSISSGRATAQKRATSHARTGVRVVAWSCSRIVLIAEVDERRLAHAFGHRV